MKKTYEIKPAFKLGFIEKDMWEVEHEGTVEKPYVGLLSIGHNRRFAKFHTENIVLESVLNTAELASDAPQMLEAIRKISEFLENNVEIYNKISDEALTDIDKFTNKYFDLKKTK